MSKQRRQNRISWLIWQQTVSLFCVTVAVHSRSIDCFSRSDVSIDYSQYQAAAGGFDGFGRFGSSAALDEITVSISVGGNGPQIRTMEMKKRSLGFWP